MAGERSKRSSPAGGDNGSEAATSALDRLTEALASLPGIGRRTAEKLAYHLLKTDDEEALALADAIRDVKEQIFACSVCAHLTEIDPCPICSDRERDRSRLCIVEQPRDVLALERTGGHDGLYHVLTGRVAPLEGHHPDDLTLDRMRQRVFFSHGRSSDAPGPIDAELLARVHPTPVTEIIIATAPDFEGDGTSLYVRQALESEGGAPLPIRLTQLARGVPQGATLEYVSSAILADALKGRTALTDTPREP